MFFRCSNSNEYKRFFLSIRYEDNRTSFPLAFLHIRILSKYHGKNTKAPQGLPAFVINVCLNGNGRERELHDIGILTSSLRPPISNQPS